MGQFLGVRGGASIAKVDPKILDIVKNAIAAQPYAAEIISGSEHRNGDLGNHGPGYAIDVQLYKPDANGKLVPLPNRGTAAYSAYETYAQAAKVYQQEKYPGLPLRTGLGFNTTASSGTLDPMHLDIRPGGTMPAYSWDKGGLGRYANLSNGGLAGENGSKLVSQYQTALASGVPIPNVDVPNASTSNTALAYAPPGPQIDPRSVTPAYDAIAAATQGVNGTDATGLYHALQPAPATRSVATPTVPAYTVNDLGNAVDPATGKVIQISDPRYPAVAQDMQAQRMGAQQFSGANATGNAAQSMAAQPFNGANAIGSANSGVPASAIDPASGVPFYGATAQANGGSPAAPRYVDANGISGTVQLPRTVTYDPVTGKMVPTTAPAQPNGNAFIGAGATGGASGAAPIPMDQLQGVLARHFNGGTDQTYVGNGASIPNPSFGGSAVPVTVEAPAPGSSGTVVNGVINGKIREMAPQIGNALGQVGGAVNRLIGNQPTTSLADTGYGPSSPTSTAGGISPVSMYTMLKNNHGTAMNTLAQMMGTSMADLGGSLGSNYSHPSPTLGTDLSYAYAPGQNGQNPNMPDSANSTMMQYLADNPAVNTAPAVKAAPVVQQLNPAYVAWERNQTTPAKAASPFAGISAAALGDSLAFDPITGLPSTLPNLSQADAQAQMNAYGAPATPRADPRPAAAPPKYIGVPAAAPPANASPSIADAPAMANWPVTTASNGYVYARDPATGKYTNIGEAPPSPDAMTAYNQANAVAMDNSTAPHGNGLNFANLLGSIASGTWQGGLYNAIAPHIGMSPLPGSTGPNAAQQLFTALGGSHGMQAPFVPLNAVQTIGANPNYVAAYNSGQSSYQPTGAGGFVPTQTVGGGARQSYGDATNGLGQSLTSTS